jgi:hypothetical protein
MVQSKVGVAEIFCEHVQTGSNTIKPEEISTESWVINLCLLDQLTGILNSVL